jgi:polysaccharide biosynthesis/export protein
MTGITSRQIRTLTLPRAWAMGIDVSHSNGSAAAGGPSVQPWRGKALGTMRSLAAIVLLTGCTGTQLSVGQPSGEPAAAPAAVRSAPADAPSAGNKQPAAPVVPAALTAIHTTAAPPQGHAWVYRDASLRPCQWAGCEQCERCDQGLHYMWQRDPAAWPNAGMGPNMPFGQGAYVDPGRVQHVAEYRLRVDDVMDIVFRRTRNEIAEPYKLSVGDRIRIEMRGEGDITRDLEIQPDGSITVPLLGTVRAARQTLDDFRRDLEDRYSKVLKTKPAVTITPILVNVRLQDLLDSVDRRYGQGGLAQDVRVTPDGTIALPAIGSVLVQGLTLDELKLELNARLSAVVSGLDVQPVLKARAPRFLFVLGEVRQPGRFTLEGPTTIMQAVALAGGITTSAAAKLKNVVVLRRGPDWELLATKINIHGPVVNGYINIHPLDELWLCDSDIVIVPKTELLVVDEYINLLFTGGVYSALPFSVNLSMIKAL